MNPFERIAIGTANWGKEYNGVKVSEGDIDKILGYAQCAGIDTIDCATAYGWDWTQVNSFFRKIVKVNANDSMAVLQKIADDDTAEIMAHDFVTAQQSLGASCTGISIYTNRDYYNLNSDARDAVSTIEVPYSLYDRRFAQFIKDEWEYHVIIARSIFLRGKIIQDGIPAEECIKFCLANPYIDKIIIGVDSIEQLQRNLDFIHKWNNLEKHDEALLDPRKW